MKIYVGTQLGNSRGVADELIGRLQEFDTTIKVSTYDLNDLINDDKKEYVTIICSTTGNGDIPENGSVLWRPIKKRNFNNSYFDELKYFIVGLGDTNYADFCAAAKKITKRLQELAETQLNSIITIDDETNDYEEKLDLVYNLIIKQLYNK